MCNGQGMKTILLGDMTEVCLGKVILKDDIVPNGNAKVVSISNMTEQGLIYEDMESTNATAEDVAKHEIREHDVLITCRGTKFRSVLVENKPTCLVIASGNLMILRCKEALDAAVIHLYIQSPEGEEQIMGHYQGKNTINLGKKQLQSMEIPALSGKRKEKMVKTWKQGREKYMNTVLEVEQEWCKTVAQVNGFFTGLDEENQAESFKDSYKANKKSQQDRLLIELD